MKSCEKFEACLGLNPDLCGSRSALLPVELANHVGAGKSLNWFLIYQERWRWHDEYENCIIISDSQQYLLEGALTLSTNPLLIFLPLLAYSVAKFNLGKVTLWPLANSGLQFSRLQLLHWLDPYNLSRSTLWLIYMYAVASCSSSQSVFCHCIVACLPF